VLISEARLESSKDKASYKSNPKFIVNQLMGGRASQLDEENSHFEAKNIN
jgi:hypothetical protein